MVRKKEILIFYITSILFICLELLFMMLNINYMAAFLPLIALIVYWALFSLDKLMLFVVFCVPISIKYHLPGLSLGQITVGFALPTEPLMFGIMLIFFLNIAYAGYDKKITRHPVSILIIISLVWMLITCFTSTMFFVSFKFLIERMWCVVTFYFLGILLFKNIKNIFTFNWMYVIAFTAVILYTFVRHYFTGFSEKGAHTASNPFYNDHTAYGALLAMFVPVLAGLSLIKKTNALYVSQLLYYFCSFYWPWPFHIAGPHG